MATIKPKKRKIQLRASEPKRRQGGIKIFVFNSYTVLGLLIASISVTCFLYLSGFNQIASQGVIINDLERERSQLIIENEVWNMRMSRLKSMDVIEKQEVVRQMPFIDPSEIEFVDLDKRED